MFHSASMPKKWMARPLSGPGLMLAEEEHEQKGDDLHNLLVVQPKLDSQCYHGSSPDYAGWPANLLRVGIYRAPCLALGLGLPRMALTIGLAFARVTLRLCGGTSVAQMARGVRGRTLSRVVARQLGLLAQVRYSARGSARVTPLKHNEAVEKPVFWQKRGRKLLIYKGVIFAF